MAHDWYSTRFCLMSACVCSVAHSCPTLCDPMDCSLPGFSVHAISQARIRGSNLHLWRLLHWQADSLPLCHLGSPWMHGLKNYNPFLSPNEFQFPKTILKKNFFEDFIFLRDVLSSQENWDNNKTSLIPTPTHAQPLYQMVHLSQLINLHWHIIATHKTQFTLLFTWSVIHSMGLDKHNGMCLSFWNIFTVLKIHCALPIHLFPFFPILYPKETVMLF